MVTPFLYNEGDGKMIPIAKIIRMRNKQRGPSKRLPASKDDQGDQDSVTGDEKTSPFARLYEWASSLRDKKSSKGW